MRFQCKMSVARVWMGFFMRSIVFATFASSDGHWLVEWWWKQCKQYKQCLLVRRGFCCFFTATPSSSQPLSPESELTFDELLSALSVRRLMASPAGGFFGDCRRFADLDTATGVDGAGGVVSYPNVLFALVSGSTGDTMIGFTWDHKSSDGVTSMPEEKNEKVVADLRSSVKLYLSSTCNSQPTVIERLCVQQMTSYWCGLTNLPFCWLFTKPLFSSCLFCANELLIYFTKPLIKTNKWINWHQVLIKLVHCSCYCVAV